MLKQMPFNVMKNIGYKIDYHPPRFIHYYTRRIYWQWLQRWSRLQDYPVGAMEQETLAQINRRGEGWGGGGGVFLK